MLNLFNISIFKSKSKCVGKLAPSEPLVCFSDKTVSDKTPGNTTRSRRISIFTFKPSWTTESKSKLVKSFEPHSQTILFRPDYTSTPKYFPVKTSTPEILLSKARKPTKIRRRNRTSKIRYNSRNSTFKDSEHTKIVSEYFVSSKLIVIESQSNYNIEIAIKRIRTATTSVCSSACFCCKANGSYCKLKCNLTYKKLI